ncbi:uncharacterized protein BDR25DRAFT_342150 [Lindgomyces ingoldianus]|uniref:Uncharacterized protein n=1 Tax=Lindgomyces ingoldianus TaxID=673940 RepID=A0ACB6QZE5_9PLEO|nr:uncharacterized protein BDR25DRAFT_342150 [Lindgomyces ingoldianus]KAF2472157.1 hypothetical protein BDR25DRAFT_342150 [Lindgomyces ingoldianus]
MLRAMRLPSLPIPSISNPLRPKKHLTSSHASELPSHFSDIVEAGDEFKYWGASELDADRQERASLQESHSKDIVPIVELPDFPSRESAENEEPWELGATRGASFHSGVLQDTEALQRTRLAEGLSMPPSSGGGRYEEAPARQQIFDCNPYQADIHHPGQGQFVGFQEGNYSLTHRTQRPSLVTSTASSLPINSLYNSAGSWSSDRDSSGHSSSSISTPSLNSAGVSSTTSQGSCGCASCARPCQRLWNSPNASCSSVNELWPHPSSDSPSAPPFNNLQGCVERPSKEVDYSFCRLPTGLNFPIRQMPLSIPECDTHPPQQHIMVPRPTSVYEYDPPVYTSPSSAVRRILWPQGCRPFEENVNSEPSGGTRIDIDGPQGRCTTVFIEADRAVPSADDSQIETCSSIQCYQCQKRFTGAYGRGNLTRHQRMKHSSLNTSFPCSICSRTYKRKDAVKKHEWEKHGRGTKPKKRHEGKRPVLGILGTYELPAPMQ